MSDKVELPDSDDSKCHRSHQWIFCYLGAFVCLSRDQKAFAEIIGIILTALYKFIYMMSFNNINIASHSETFEVVEVCFVHHIFHLNFKVW